MNKITKEINRGDKIILKDGLTGKITYIDENGAYNIRLETGETYATTFPESELHEYYLIGGNIIGNKIDRDILEQEIDHTKESLRLLKKQLWRIDNVMDGEINPHRTYEKRPKGGVADLNNQYSDTLRKLSSQEFHALKKYFSTLHTIEKREGENGENNDR